MASHCTRRLPNNPWTHLRSTTCTPEAQITVSEGEPMPAEVNRVFRGEDPPAARATTRTRLEQQHAQ
eukprot:15451836-Alexandrium_andersonii.AAC.1